MQSADGLTEEVEARQSWFHSKRAYPFDSIPAGARRRAWESRPRELKGHAQVASGGRLVWKSIGPSPTIPPPVPHNWGGTSGRINSVAVSPADTQLVLVGSSTGGIWRSTDGGTTFTPVSDDQLDINVSWIAFAPSNPAIVYAAMGDIDYYYLGTGVLKSTDGGRTWARVSNATLPDGVNARLEVDPNDANRVYLAQFRTLEKSTNTSSDSGFFLSTDGGVNWTKTLAGQASDLVISPSDPRTLYLATAWRIANLREGVPAGLYRSTDGGLTWTRIFDSPFSTRTYDFRLAISPAAPQRIYIFFGSVFTGEKSLMVSNDSGATWAERSISEVDTGLFGFATYIFIDPTNADIVYLGTRDLYKSTNGGASWTNMTNNFRRSGNSWIYQPSVSSIHADQQAFAFEPRNPATVYLANDGGLWKSSDGGTTVRALNNTLSLVQFNSLTLHPTDAGVTFGGTQDNGTQHRLKDAETNAPGVKWADVSGSDGGDCLFNPLDPTIFFGTYYSGWVNRFKISSTCVCFVKQIGSRPIWGEEDTNTRIAFYPPFVGNGVDQKLYFGTWRLFISNNLGDSWTAPASTTDLTKGGRDVLNAIAVARSNTSVIYTGSVQGRAMVSTDEGATWTDITAGLPNRAIEEIAVHPNNPSVAYLTVSGYGSGHVFRTSNAGATWTDISGNLPNIPTNAILLDPLAPTTLYVGTDIGVFRSMTDGFQWETFNNGLPPVAISAFAAQTSGHIQVATYGRGAYELTAIPVGPSSVSFETAAVEQSEQAGSVRLTITRTGDLTLPAQVDYATTNGTASDRSDYTAAAGTLQFNVGEATKTLEIFIIDDAFSEETETFSLNLSNPVNTSLGSRTSVTLTITSDDAAGSPNPVRNSTFNAQFFVRQHYLDFFNREPDAAGLAFWTNQITECESRAEAERQSCREIRRINVSAAFFLSAEFQQTGYYAYRTHQVAFNTGERLLLRNFLPDVRELGRGVVGGVGNWEQQLDANKQAYVQEFVNRQSFLAVYPLTMSSTQFVATLNANAGNILTESERAALVAGLDNRTETRASVLRKFVEHPALRQRELNRAFVLMQYFGYLRRNPPDAPELTLDFQGYNFWLRKLEEFNGNFVAAEMVKAFITSGEYQGRFGP